ncbi:MAG: D-2-hydroxyacid dehydrogenase [Opitutaceae bacterium]|nr:D-2-hydroxyacid dehydrogenase [Opitutaceae bacterium]
MKISRLPFLAFLIPVLALAQSTLPSKKVVFVGGGGLGESQLSELRAAAPSVNLVVVARNNLMKEIADADGVIGTINAEQFRAAKKLKWLQMTSAGVENVLAIPELRNSNVTLTNMKIVQGVEIADHALALLLGLTRRIDRAVESRATETWHSLANYGGPLELSGKTAVIVGVGGIGMQIAVRAKAFGMTVIGVDPNDIPYTPHLDRTVWPDRLETVLPEADVVLVAAPHTAQTEKIFQASQFAKMKKGAFFIAVSRGKLYDAMALAEALKSGHLAGAGLDVTDPEPLPKGHPLWKTERVIITPHIAGRSDGEGPRYFAIYKENLERFAKGEPLRHTVDKQKGY